MPGGKSRNVERNHHEAEGAGSEPRCARRGDCRSVKRQYQGPSPAVEDPMTHTLLVSRHAASRARREISGNFRSYQDLVYSAAISRVSFAFQSPRSWRPSIRANSRLLPFSANDVGYWGKSRASCTEQSEHPSEPLRLRKFRKNGTPEIGKRKWA
jgi:hypothetical protein